MDTAALHGASRRHQRLSGDLSAEHPLTVLVGTHASEDVHLDRLEIEELDQKVERVRPSANPAVRASPRRMLATVCSRDIASFPRGSSGGPRQPRTRSRAATSTTTGGSSSTHRAPVVPSRAATPATAGTVGPRISTSSPDLGLGSYRFSVEWSRIEPAEGEWSKASLDHYRRVVAGLQGTGDPPGRHLSATSPIRDGSLREGDGRPPTHRSGSRDSALDCRGLRRHRRDGLHTERAEHRLADGLPRRCVPSGRARRRA